MTALIFTLAWLSLSGKPGEAHKPITSPYTYNEDVFPILRERCGRCHVPGGVAPMSLMTYKDAFPWGESIRTELIAGHMPPWPVEEGQGRFRNAHPLPARELNIVLTWVTGGNPVGDPARETGAVSVARDWPLGPPDLALPLPADYTLAADKSEGTAEFTLGAPAADERWIRAVDVLPGNPAIVRSATVTVRSKEGPERDQGLPRPERVVAMWVPGEDPVVPEGAAFRLPGGAELVARVHYKKTWEYERRAMTDRSVVGVYFSPPRVAELRALTLRSTDPRVDGRRISFSHTIGGDVEVVALYPDPGLINAAVSVTAVRPDGSQLDLIRFRPQADWLRRYWFERPLLLPRGTRIDVAGTFDAPLLPPGAVPVPSRPVDPQSARMTLDVVSR